MLDTAPEAAVTPPITPKPSHGPRPFSVQALLRRLRARWWLMRRDIRDGGLRNYPYTRVLIAALAGGVAGLGVVLLRDCIDLFHTLVFAIPFRQHLSDGEVIEPWRLLAVPVAGGLAVGIAAWIIRWRRPGDIVDAIEANALHGGRMSVTDSLNLAAMTLLSGGFGASVGLEAAYTQLGAGFASKLGRSLRLRRADVRTLVGCGAAAAIAAAFNAPLTGAFYAFELIIGSYTLATLLPVTIAALAGTFAARQTFGSDPIFVVKEPLPLHTADYIAFVFLGIGAAGVAILSMKGVTYAEAWFRRFVKPRILSPVLGGLFLGLLALVWPQVLGSGHGAIRINLHANASFSYLIVLLAAKIAASAISIGAGFRGGMFSASLFMGTLFGGASAILLAHLMPWLDIAPLPYTLVGMGSVAAGIVGAPITMILLVLESTGDFSIAIGVTVGVLTTTAIVREQFGYSFATWRFHLRGLKITSPEDIGWVAELKVGRLMRADPKIVAESMSLASLRKLYPIGAAKQLFAVDDGAFVGLVDAAELHARDRDKVADSLTAADIMRPIDSVLVPGQPLSEALGLFNQAESETLAVVDNREDRRVIGYLSEAYALKRYSQELEKRHSGSSLFGAVSNEGS